MDRIDVDDYANRLVEEVVLVGEVRNGDTF